MADLPEDYEDLTKEQRAALPKARVRGGGRSMAADRKEKLTGNTYHLSANDMLMPFHPPELVDNQAISNIMLPKAAKKLAQIYVKAGIMSPEDAAKVIAEADANIEYGAELDAVRDDEVELGRMDRRHGFDSLHTDINDPEDVADYEAEQERDRLMARQFRMRMDGMGAGPKPE